MITPYEITVGSLFIHEGNIVVVTAIKSRETITARRPLRYIEFDVPIKELSPLALSSSTFKSLTFEHRGRRVAVPYKFTSAVIIEDSIVVLYAHQLSMLYATLYSAPLLLEHYVKYDVNSFREDGNTKLYAHCY
jgi:hypothetical protein